jgi:hypothetical protein
LIENRPHVDLRGRVLGVKVVVGRVDEVVGFNDVESALVLRMATKDENGVLNRRRGEGQVAESCSGQGRLGHPDVVCDVVLLAIMRRYLGDPGDRTRNFAPDGEDVAVEQRDALVTSRLRKTARTTRETQ